MKLVIADDEHYIRHSLSHDVPWSKHGISLVGVASDGQEAIELCRNLRPDILITDIRMPFYNGIEVMRELKNDLPKLKTILLSGWSDFEYAREAIRLGASNYLVKPCPDEEIVDAVLVAMEESGSAITDRKPVQSDGEETLSGTTKRHAVKMACEIIHADLSRAVTLTEVASRINMNPSAFSRLFRQEMNCSFSEFVTSARINMAKKLLIESNMKILDVAQNVGYVSVSHFVQVFGDYTGMTPGSFREMNG